MTRGEGSRRLPRLRALALVAVAVAVAAVGAATAAAEDRPVTILTGTPATFDPAQAGDATTSAVLAQLYETLTAFDPDLKLQPALAASWETLDDGHRIRFTLRPGLRFSDGSPLTADDVVRSWLRVIDPARPSPLAVLASDVEGAVEYLEGRQTDPARVGLVADGDVVEVRLVRPTDFASVVSSPTFAIVPAGITADVAPGSFVGSGAYRLAAVEADRLVLRANERYWAGPPAIRDAVLLTEIGGRSPVEAFEDGDVDYTPVAEFDASWIAYDATLGPALAETPSLSLEYYGFDTTRPPFADVRVRQAFARAVDWRRIVTLVSSGTTTPADGMVPLGIPGRSVGSGPPDHDPDAARALLAAAGFPGGRGFPEISLVSGGSPYDVAVARDLEATLGIDVVVERLDADSYWERLESDPPPMWALGWIADYPSPNDFLGVLLGSGSSSNVGGWSSGEFDAAIEEAVGAREAADAAEAYARAEAIVQRDAPAIPLGYSVGWSLVRPGLLGATENGLGILRLAGLAWDE